MFSLFILLLLVQDIIHLKIIKYIVKNSTFLMFSGFKMQMKISFMVLKFGSLAFEKFWKFFERSVYEPCITQAIQ